MPKIGIANGLSTVVLCILMPYIEKKVQVTIEPISHGNGIDSREHTQPPAAPIVKVPAIFMQTSSF